MATLSDLQAAQAAALTQAYKTRQNREAAKIAAAIALYYRVRVDPEDPVAVERWLELMVPRLIRSSNNDADRASSFFNTLRQLELAGDRSYVATPSYDVIDSGVRKSLLTQGPFDFMNKASEIRNLDVSPTQEKALLIEAKQMTTKKLAASVIRHAQAGGRQTIFDNSQRDEVALGWVRVTKAKPCFFCAMLASRGLQYRSFKEGSFDESDSRFTGDGNAKVHDRCGCSLKPVYTNNDPLVDQTKTFAELWTEWGAGGGDSVLRFRRGYEHFVDTGEKISWEQANEGLRAA